MYGNPWENCQVASVSEPPSPALAPSHPKADKDKRLKIWSTALTAGPTVLFPFTMVLVFLCYYRKIKGKGARKDKHSGTNIILQIKVCNSQLGRIWNWTNPIHKVDKIKLEIPFNLIKVVPIEYYLQWTHLKIPRECYEEADSLVKTEVSKCDQVIGNSLMSQFCFCYAFEEIFCLPFVFCTILKLSIRSSLPLKSNLKKVEINQLLKTFIHPCSSGSRECRDLGNNERT